MKDVVLAILAKDKAYCLDFYLQCLLNQTFDKKRTHLYIRTNDNRDNTQEILENFIAKHGIKYKSVLLDYRPVSETLKNYEEHEWNSERFSILGEIRQESIDYAIKKNAHYMVVDCDNFITKDVIQDLYNDRELGVVGPLLRLTNQHYYANYHNQSCPSGYYQNNDEYHPILDGRIKGKIQVSTIHCTYFVNNLTLPAVSYNDGSGRYEYAIFSDALRIKGIPQYLDNTKFHGFLFLNDQIPLEFGDYIDQYWKDEYCDMNK